MLKQLRFDGYKLIHSRMLWIVYAVSFILMLITPITTAAVEGNSASVFATLEHMEDTVFVNISVVRFVAFFVAAGSR